MLDLAQGPHLLVAGTSGSGKSELLQTLVASLAVANRPDAMNFVLIDYKGGAAFRGFSPLPHTVGMLTDLDEFLVERALTSLHAELQRRKAVLDAADKSDIRRYWDALPGMPGWDPLPRLVIVVDEFAVMAEKLPDQLRSLMVIGRQGRSLGIHLVLATQRPAGIVNNDLRSNINLRIALRVSSQKTAGTSSRPPMRRASRPRAAAAGRTPGWAAATRSPSRPPTSAASAPARRRPRWRTPWPARCAGPTWACPAADSTARDRPDGAADRPVRPGHGDRVRRLGRTAGPSAFPGVRCRQLPRGYHPGPAAGRRRQQALRLPYGLIDQPQSQQQIPAVLDIARGGHLLAAGAPQSGRSTLLRTLAGALAAQVSPDEAHLYVLDGGRALSRALSALPHCGAVVTVRRAGPG